MRREDMCAADVPIFCFLIFGLQINHSLALTGKGNTANEMNKQGLLHNSSLINPLQTIGNNCCHFFKTLQKFTYACYNVDNPFLCLPKVVRKF